MGDSNAKSAHSWKSIQADARPTQGNNERKGKSMKLAFMAIFFMCGFLASSSGEPQKHAAGVAQCRTIKGGPAGHGSVKNDAGDVNLSH